MTLEPPTVTLEQVENFEFTVDFGNPAWAPQRIDAPSADGKGTGPSAGQNLALAVGQCMSSTLVYTLERARVPVSKMTTRVRLTMGTNERGRHRVRKLEVEIQTAPLHEEDRGRFDQCVATFEDFCPISGAVREGTPTELHVVEHSGT